MRRCRYTSCVTASTTSFGYRSAVRRSRAMRAPTTSWWWNDARPCSNDRVFGLPTSCSNAASRSTRSGLTFWTTAIVCARTSLWWWIGSCSSRIALSSGRNSSESFVRARNHRPGAGSSTTNSFESSSRIRSALTISSRPRCSPTASIELRHRLQPEAGDEPRRAQHPQRVVGERDGRRLRGAQPALDQVDRAVERIDEHGVGQPQRHRVDREVAP